VNGVNAKVNPINILDWFDLQRQLEKYYGPKHAASWAFRGVGEAEWELKSSLERMELQIPLIEAERYLLTTFQRRAHHYISDPPDKEDYLEWLALLQHHGAPTRLLDWTKSPYVALFFALDQLRYDGGCCALWAIDLQWCKQQARQNILSSSQINMFDPDESLGKPETFRAVFFNDSPIQFVAPLQPFRMNERLTIQQGLFLCPGDLQRSFEENLLAFTYDFSDHVHKIVIPNKLREDMLMRLNRMNINRASLFPGIDGFAQSLVNNLQIATHWGKLSSEIKRLNIYSEYGFL